MIGFVDQYGEYHPGKKGSNADPNSSQFKSWSHDRQRADHQWELLQPYKNGRPNPEFMEAYPEESQINGMNWENA